MSGIYNQKIIILLEETKIFATNIETENEFKIFQYAKIKNIIQMTNLSIKN